MATYNFNTQKVTSTKQAMDGKKTSELSHDMKMAIIKKAHATLKKGN